MDTQNFEEKLKQMTKPEINQLKHQDMLADAITKAKDKSVVSWWWLIIPLYVISTLLMKTFFIPDTTLISNIHEFTSRQRFTSTIFLLILPIIFILVSFFNIRKIYFLSGNSKSVNLLKRVWLDILTILFSTLILIIYAL
jgi:magnesium-transporting ATPase (P-type)